MDKQYLDVRFDGLEKLMVSQIENLDSHLRAVSTNVKEVRVDLAAHEKSLDAHGAGGKSKWQSDWMGWLTLVVAVGMLVIEIRRH